ncbi:MAG: hypothetical protein JWM85_805 [Acidimicrobiaceae bacterium]|nr:hypothetical protein [Acidimicrobiaceae bacterium]
MIVLLPFTVMATSASASARVPLTSHPTPALPKAPAGWQLVTSTIATANPYGGTTIEYDHIQAPPKIEVRFTGKFAARTEASVILSCGNGYSPSPTYRHAGLYIIPIDTKDLAGLGCLLSATLFGTGRYGVQFLVPKTPKPKPKPKPTATKTPTAGTTPPAGTTTPTATKPTPKPTPNPCPVETQSCKYPYDGAYSGTIGGTVTITASGGEEDLGAPPVGTSTQFDAPASADVSGSVVENLYSYGTDSASGQNAIFDIGSATTISNSGLATGLEFFSGDLTIDPDSGDTDSIASLSCSSFSMQFNATGAGTSGIVCTGSNAWGDTVEFTGSVNLSHLIPTD